MIAVLEIFIATLKELIAAGKDSREREDALMRAEERLAILRKKARYSSKGSQ